MNWLCKLIRALTPRLTRQASAIRSVRPGLEQLETREVPSTNAPTFTLQSNGNLLQVSNGKSITIDENVVSYEAINNPAGQVTLVDLHQNGQLMERNPAGQWTTLFSNVQSIQGFSDPAGNATIEVLGKTGSLWQYTVNSGSWSLVAPTNVQWMQGTADSKGDLATLYWLTTSGQLWERLASGQQSQINSFVQSVTLNSQGIPQVTFDPIGTYLSQPGHSSGLGPALTGRVSTPVGQGLYAQFLNGAVYWSAQTGPHAIEGTIYQRWLSLGGLNNLGFPTTDAQGSSNEIQLFQNGAIYAQAGSTPMVLTGSGNAAIDAAVINVYSQLTDPTVAQLTLSAVTTDGSLDRTAMIDILRGVEAKGTVTASEFASLQKLLTLDGSLNVPASVQDLTDKVVDGDPANSTYQGASLGNLSVGSSAGQLDKLIDKWFYGTDLPSSGGYTYQIASGTLFGPQGQPSYQQIVQGEVGDCYLLAALGTLAQRDPQAIQAMITDNHDSLTPGDDTYTVRFWNSDSNSWDYVTVDSELPVYSWGQLVYAGMGSYASSTSNVLWVALIEKAYAQENQEGTLGKTASNSYAALNSGFPFQALINLTGKTASYSTLTTAQALASIWSSGGMIILDTKQVTPDPSVVANHSYVVTGYNASTGVFTLFNPWGIDGAGIGSQFEPGTLNLTWSQIVQNFQSVNWQNG